MSKTLEEITCKTSRFMEYAKYRHENRDWLHVSQDIALSILNYIDMQCISKLVFAELIDVSLEDINSMVKGSYDFTISQISAINKIIQNETISG